MSIKKIKPGVQLYGTRPEMVQVDNIVTLIFLRHGYNCVETSGVGKKHKKHSLHPVGFAKDYRTKHLPDGKMKRKMLAELKDALPCCDILFEYEGQSQEHYHIEFDPKDDLTFQEHKIFYRKHGYWPPQN